MQNADAFNFTDDLIGGDVRYETAGSFRGGKQIWLLARMPERKIAGDMVEPFLCFTNSHDGSGGLKVCMTPIRVVCNNTLNLALDSAKRVWSIYNELIRCFFPYNRSGILDLLNHEICCDFTHIIVTDGIDLDADTTPLSGAI